MDSMKASLPALWVADSPRAVTRSTRYSGWGRRGARLMRSSRSISYWDLGATGMFDGILIDERGAVLR